MKKTLSILFFTFACVLISCGMQSRDEITEKAVKLNRMPKINPDYIGVTIPPNISPLNFHIMEDGKKCYVKIYSKNGKSINIYSKNGKIIINEGKWRKLLKQNQNQDICFDVYSKENTGGWKQYETIKNRIAGYDIDGYVVYRYIPPIYNLWNEISIKQRNLTNFNIKEILNNRYLETGCMNCHTFYKNQTDKISMQVRGALGSMIIAKDKNTEKIMIKPKAAYMSWHPNGKLIAFSTNDVKQFFHSSGKEVRDVIDMNSSLGIYVVDSNKVTSVPEISKADRLETYPAWSPDGKYLYFCSAPLLWKNFETVPPLQYKEIKYDLMRISYDPETGKWGKLDSMILSKDTGLSILQPRISPDGRFLLFSMCEYGCFPIYQPSSDIYIMDLKTAKFRKLSINSDQSDSWHSWSSNSRWFVFCSKRPDGIFGKLFFSFVNDSGNATKPFCLPQPEPDFYESFSMTFNVPELIKEPVNINSKAFYEAMHSKGQYAGELPITSASPKAKK